jgi:hypothetical protein
VFGFKTSFKLDIKFRTGLFFPVVEANRFTRKLIESAGKTSSYVERDRNGDSTTLGRENTRYGKILAESKSSTAYASVVLPNRETFASKVEVGNFYLYQSSTGQKVVYVSSIVRTSDITKAEVSVAETTGVVFLGDEYLPILNLDFSSTKHVHVDNIVRPAHVVPMCSVIGIAEKEACLSLLSKAPKGCSPFCIGLAGSHAHTNNYIWNLYFVK